MGTQKSDDADASRRDFLRKGTAAGVGVSAAAALGSAEVTAKAPSVVGI